MEHIHIGIIGMGRIGQVHLKSIALHFPQVILHVMSSREEGRNQAKRFGVQHVYSQIEEIMEVTEIRALLICSATDTHVEYVYRGINAGKDLFCEKPLAFSLKEIRDIEEAANAHNRIVMVGFNQRFDPSWSDIKRRVDSGEVGDTRLIQITSRDPFPPSLEFAKVSGGLFLDMTIHDFDMCRYIAGKEVKEVYAKAAAVRAPGFAEIGDQDLAVIVLTFTDNSLAIIDNSRESAYGYDQRMEVFGTQGLLKGENHRIHNNWSYNKAGVHGGVPPHFFMDRYAESYRLQIGHFLDVLNGASSQGATVNDVYQATAIALGAQRSLESAKPYKLYSE